MYDVIVVGGNLSGAPAAINAKSKDVKVALIEKRLSPFNPPHCGEGILDVTADLLNIKKIDCKYNIVDTVTMNIADKEFTFNLKKHKMFTFDRFYLEKFLLEKAKKLGIDVFLGDRMIEYNPPNDIILDKKGLIQGKVIIDATGLACQIGKRVGLKTEMDSKDIGVCIQSRIEGDFSSNDIKFWFHKPYAPFGYAWIFPINNKLANIGLGIAGGQKLDLTKLLSDYLNNQCKNNYRIISTIRACVPQSVPLEQLVKDNVMIVGDAGRLVDAPTAAGIQNAYFSGSLSGIIANKYIKGEINTLYEYQKHMENKLNILKKQFYRKNKAILNEKIYQKSFCKKIAFLNRLHRISPIFCENLIAKRLNKDIILLNSLTK